MASCSHTHPRILLIEDDPLIASIMLDMLEAADFEVDGPYASLSDGVAALAEHMPDCAVLDIGLQDRDVSLLAGDLELYDIPFIFCSGRSPHDAFLKRFVGHPFVMKDRANSDLVPTLRRILH